MHTRCVPSHTPRLAAVTVVPSVILEGSNPCQLSCSRSTVATFAPGDLRCLEKSHTFGTACGLADLVFSRH